MLPNLCVRLLYLAAALALGTSISQSLSYLLPEVKNGHPHGKERMTAYHGCGGVCLPTSQP